MGHHQRRYHRKSLGRSNDEGSGKNRNLFMQAIHDMFRNIVNNNWGIPAQIEVEQHISNTFSDDLLKEGFIFPFVHFCRGGNPQEKRAEHFINRKKYDCKRNAWDSRAVPSQEQKPTGFNEDKNTVRYSFEEIVANENADITTWNNALHPDQDKYPGQTRWQVLTNNMNPQLVEPDLSMISRYIGNATQTSVYRSQYVVVKHNKYALPSAEVIAQLTSLHVTAYFIPAQDGTIKRSAPIPKRSVRAPAACWKPTMKQWPSAQKPTNTSCTNNLATGKTSILP